MLEKERIKQKEKMDEHAYMDNQKEVLRLLLEEE